MIQLECIEPASPPSLQFVFEGHAYLAARTAPKLSKFANVTGNIGERKLRFVTPDLDSLQYLTTRRSKRKRAQNDNYPTTSPAAQATTSSTSLASSSSQVASSSLVSSTSSLALSSSQAASTSLGASSSAVGEGMHDDKSTEDSKKVAEQRLLDRSVVVPPRDDQPKVRPSSEVQLPWRSRPPTMTKPSARLLRVFAVVCTQQAATSPEKSSGGDGCNSTRSGLERMSRPCRSPW